MLTIRTLSDKILFVRRSGGMADAQASGACSRKAVWVQVPSPASRKLFRGIWKAFLFCKNGRKKKGARNLLLRCSDVSRTDETRSGGGFSSEVFGRFTDRRLSGSDSRSTPVRH